MLTTTQLRLISSHSSLEIKNTQNSQEWLNFARRCQKNPFMKYIITNRDKHNRCEWCSKPFFRNQKRVLHHIDYDHVCITDKLISFANPTEKRPNRTIKAPDCESCFANHSDAFHKCATRLKLVHSLCNKEIEEARQQKV